MSRAISRQGEPGKEWHYSELKAVYLIALLNFRQRTISDELRTDVALMDMKHTTLFSDKLRMVFLQLPYFTKEADECETLFDRIIYVLKHMDVLKRMPWMAQEAVFQKLASIADVVGLTWKRILLIHFNFGATNVAPLGELRPIKGIRFKSNYSANREPNRLRREIDQN